jgi:hypothetical protein
MSVCFNNSVTDVRIYDENFTVTRKTYTNAECSSIQESRV